MNLVPRVLCSNPFAARLQIHTYILPGESSWHCQLDYIHCIMHVHPSREIRLLRNESKSQDSHVYNYDLSSSDRWSIDTHRCADLVMLQPSLMEVLICHLDN